MKLPVERIVPALLLWLYILSVVLSKTVWDLVQNYAIMKQIGCENMRP